MRVGAKDGSGSGRTSFNCHTIEQAFEWELRYGTDEELKEAIIAFKETFTYPDYYPKENPTIVMTGRQRRIVDEYMMAYRSMDYRDPNNYPNNYDEYLNEIEETGVYRWEVIRKKRMLARKTLEQETQIGNEA